MKSTETPKFEHLCETISNVYDYYEMLAALKNAAHWLEFYLDHLITSHQHDTMREATQFMLTRIAETELLIALVKQRCIHDIIEEYEKTIDDLVEMTCVQLGITDD